MNKEIIGKITSLMPADENPYLLRCAELLEFAAEKDDLSFLREMREGQKELIQFICEHPLFGESFDIVDTDQLAVKLAVIDSEHRRNLLKSVAQIYRNKATDQG